MKPSSQDLHPTTGARFVFDRLPSGPLVCDVEPDVVQAPDRLHHTLAANPSQRAVLPARRPASHRAAWR